MKLVISILLFVCISGIGLKAQTVSPYRAITYQHSITSDTDHDYQVFVTLPPDYTPDQTYPVIYYLDAWWLSEIVRGTYALGYLSDRVEPLILVGISSKGDEDEWHRQRNYDFTPSPYRKPKSGIIFQAGTVPMDSTNTGGGPAFVQFLRDQLIPFIESEYAVDSGSRGIIGHSFGGLLGVYLLQQEEQLFDKLLLISPSLWWNQSEILQDWSPPALDQSTALFLTIGGDEFGLIKRPAQRFYEQLESADLPLLEYRYEIYSGADHNSVLSRAIYDGLEWLYGE